MSAMTISIERKPLTLTIDNQPVPVELLSIRLPFGRKPFSLCDLAATGEEAVYVTETREMSTVEFDAFAANLGQSRDWLKGKGGYFGEGRLCVEIHAPERPYLYVDPSGGDYPRYVARLG